MNYDLFWIDAKYKDIINNETRDIIENILVKKYHFIYKPFETLDKAIEELLNKKYKFKTVFVIVSGRIYQDYYLTLKKIRSVLTCIPVTLIYTSTSFRKTFERKKDDKNNIKKETLESIGNKYYNWGGVADTPEEIKTFLGKYLEINELIEPNEDILKKDKIYLFNFEPIKNFEDLILPSLYTKAESVVNKTSDMELSAKKLNEKLDSNFSIISNKFPLIEQTKFWINFYTKDQNFYKVMGNEFLKNDFTNYNAFPKALYKGLEKGYLKSEFKVPLYFGSSLTKEQYNYIENNLKKSKLKTILLYSKKILSFSKDKNKSINYVKEAKNNYDIPILFETNISGISKYSETLSYNVDVTKLSEFPEEKAVEFLPFSCFLIEDTIKEEKLEKINFKIIKLNYLGKYLDKIYSQIETLNENSLEILLNNNSSIFSKDIKNKYIKNEGKNDKDYNGLIKKLLLGSKLLTNKNPDKEKSKIKNENIIKIKLLKPGKYLNQDYFNLYQNLFDVYYDGKFQPKPLCDIIDFLPNEIAIKFKNILMDCEEMFADCNNIEEINFINFESNAVTSMAYMFADCEKLKRVSFNHFNTIKVFSMEEMFSGCKDLIELNLKNFDTRNVINMSGMFMSCIKIKNLNLLNFNINNVINMSAMFKGCTELQELLIDLNNAQNLKDISYIFRGAKNLKFKLYDFQFEKIENHLNIF